MVADGLLLHVCRVELLRVSRELRPGRREHGPPPARDLHLLWLTRSWRLPHCGAALQPARLGHGPPGRQHPRRFRGRRRGRLCRQEHTTRAMCRDPCPGPDGVLAGQLPLGHGRGRDVGHRFRQPRGRLLRERDGPSRGGHPPVSAAHHQRGRLLEHHGTAELAGRPPQSPRARRPRCVIVRAHVRHRDRWQMAHRRWHQCLLTRPCRHDIPHQLATA
mmetsp:Transcript_47496/g.151547  ORF Transcript_47496/g.151547 Transcript_47496/m.151547 type:complete len:218 (-) Transcript_47496:31-684(-)